MRYQLPDGTTAEVSLDEYLKMDDDTFNIMIMGKQHFSSIDAFLPLTNELDSIDNKSIDQIIRDMPEE